MYTSWESENLEDEAWELVGRRVMAPTFGPDVVDPVFHLCGGVDLSIRADTDLGPWAMMLPGAVIVGRKG